MLEYVWLSVPVHDFVVLIIPEELRVCAWLADIKVKLGVKVKETGAGVRVDGDAVEACDQERDADCNWEEVLLCVRECVMPIDIVRVPEVVRLPPLLLVRDIVLLRVPEELRVFAWLADIKVIVGDKETVFVRLTEEERLACCDADADGDESWVLDTVAVCRCDLVSEGVTYCERDCDLLWDCVREGDGVWHEVGLELLVGFWLTDWDFVPLGVTDDVRVRVPLVEGLLVVEILLVIVALGVRDNEEVRVTVWLDVKLPVGETERLASCELLADLVILGVTFCETVNVLEWVELHVADWVIV